MRIVAKSTLKAFQETYQDYEKPLPLGFGRIKKGTWSNPNEIKAAFKRADQVESGRIVFNIARNKYRLIVLFLYETQICYIRFIGMHK
jgi:mRNA interferase HigB